MFIFPCLVSAALFAQTVPDHEYPLRPVGHDERSHLTFEPLVTWTYQHATKVLDGMPHAKAVGYYDVSGAYTLWNNAEGLGQIAYQLQGNISGGTSTNPSMSSIVGNPMAMNNILTSEKFALSDVYWQQSFGNHGTRFRIGKLHVPTFFDRNAIAYDSVSGFMAQNFNQSITNPMPGHGFGLNLEWDVTENSLLRLGTANSEPGNVNSSGFDGLSREHLFTSAEIVLTRNPTINGEERTGHFRFMLWNKGISDPNGAGDINGWGGLFNFDQQVADNLTLFGRLGWGASNVAPSDFSISCGVQFDSPFGWKDTTTGFAYQYAELSSGGGQTVGEWFLRTKWQEDSSLHIGPVIQYYDDDNINGSMIWGIRTSLSF